MWVFCHHGVDTFRLQMEKMLYRYESFCEYTGIRCCGQTALLVHQH